MSLSLHLFNPDHDLALANGDENFNSPQSALTFAQDLGCLPMWYAESHDLVLALMPYKDWLENIRLLFPQLSSIQISSKPDLNLINRVRPWGWNSVITKILLNKGVDLRLLPPASQIMRLRNLSHRRNSILVMEKLQENFALKKWIPAPGQLISEESVRKFVEQYPKTILKAPWSGSGKGLCWANGVATDNIIGWCANIIEKQGSILAEQVYDKLQDFAMEFLCDEENVTFSGYSLFNTERGVYRCNELLSDKSIEHLLTQKWISEELLLIVRDQLSCFIKREIAPVYNGYVGVDMFIYQENDRFMIHPCVEINLRMTMGMVARIFYDRFVSSTSTGRMFIDHYPRSKELSDDHENRQHSMPLEVVDGKIVKGYLSLSPISKNSHYRARIEVV